MSQILIPARHRADHQPQVQRASASIEGRVVDSPNITANELLMAKTVAEELHKHYPGHLWAVQIEGPRLIVRNIYLSGNYGFVLMIPDIYSISSLAKDATKAGGELLERYKQKRGAMNVADIHELPVDYAGRHTPEL